MEITEVDPFDDAAFDAWHATYAAAERHGRGEWASDWLLEESRAEKQAAPTSRRVRIFAAVETGESDAAAETGESGAVAGATEPVAVAEIEVFLLDNLEMAWGKVYTHPDHRRRGHGSALLAHLEQVAVAEGRRLLTTEVAYPSNTPQDGAGHPDVDFLTRRGFDFGIGDVQRVLDLPVDEALLTRLEEEAAPHHTACRLESFSGRVPEAYVADYAELCANLATQAPTGELDLEPESGDVAAFRAEEETIERQGRTRHGTVAIAPDGRLAGYTDLVTSVHDPGRGYQWGTLVWPQHRGHRLGTALKVRNVARLQRDRPDIRVIRTWNAEVNAPMVGVNVAMGFRPVERLGEFQKTLGAP